MKRKVITSIVLGFLLPGILMAQGFQRGKKGFGKMPRNQQELQSILDDEQAEQWSEIKLKFQKERNELRTKLQNARLDLKHLMGSSRLPDEKEVDKLSGNVAEYSSQLHQLGTEQQLAFRGILSDEQWAEIQEMKKGTKKMRRGRATLNRMRHQCLRRQQRMR